MFIKKLTAEQALRIGTNVTISVIEISQGQVKLAIDAPKDVLILREELKDRANSPR